MTVRLEARPPAEAIAALEVRRRNLVETFDHRDMWEEEHATAGTVARSAGFDILTDIFDGLKTSLEEGKTGADFAKIVRPLLEAKGWWGRADVTDPLTGEVSEVQLGSPRRLQTIFDANMRVSYAAGAWAQFERTKATRPYLRWVTVMDGRARPEHRARHNLCLPVDDPYWDRWAPPCDYGCRCTLQSLSQRDVDRMRSQLKFKPRPDVMRSWTNGRTGEVMRLPIGIGPGWGHNPGKAGHQAVLAAAKLAGAPPRLAAAAVSDPAWPTRKLADEFSAWFDKVRESPANGDRQMWPVGALDRRTIDQLTDAGMAPESGAITIQAQAVWHMLRDAKQLRGAAVPAAQLRRLPELLANPRAIVLDQQSMALMYVFDVPDEPRLGKLVVRVNYVAKTRVPGAARQTITTNAVLTAGLVKVEDLRGRLYRLISGSL